LLPDGAPIIGIGPTANWHGKAWTTENFAALFRALTDGPLAGARVAVFAGPGPKEEALAAPMRAALPGAIDLCGKLNIPEVVACLERCALYVGNDSGLMHLAAATGIPTLGLFGPTPWREYAPRGKRAGFVVSPDGTMAGLDVAAALDAAIALLRAGPVASPPGGA
jgi:ADP-heptose:LPS heptosyltransferase